MGALYPLGAIGFIHQKGLYYDDPGSGKLRAALLPRLVWRFHFLNLLKLFASIDHHNQFELAIAGKREAAPRFSMHANLFHPRTIDETLTHSGLGEIPGIKSTDEEWIPADTPHGLSDILKPCEIHPFLSWRERR